MSRLSETTTANAWKEPEKKAWLARQTIQRSYARDVERRIKKLSTRRFDIRQYGSINLDAPLPVDADFKKAKGLKDVKHLKSGPKELPLYRVRSKNWNPDNPTILITGGVHGYEPSGIMGALTVLEELAPQYDGKVNFIVYPCVSPVGYEINHRWNQKTEDPNRHFYEGTTVEEARLLIADLQHLNLNFDTSIDLHETNDRDKELIKERRARDGETLQPGDEIIPVGFYLVVTKQDDVGLGQEVVAAVRDGGTVICTDDDILGEPNQNGVIVVSMKGLCQDYASKISGMAMTTEIYPDGLDKDKKIGQDWSEAAVKLSTLRAKDEAVIAQVDAVRAAINIGIRLHDARRAAAAAHPAGP